METDKDHIHYMIETEPTMSVSKAINLMKSYTTYHIVKDTQTISKSISGRNILSGQMDILLVAQETFQKKHSVNTQKTKAEKGGGKKC